MRPIDIAIPLAALAVAIALRMLVVEPSAVGQACDVARWEGWCAARTALVLSFRYQEFGWFALAVGVIATFSRRRWLGHAALALGLAGLVLYSYEPAVVAALLGALVVFRPARGAGQPPTASPAASAAASPAVPGTSITPLPGSDSAGR